MSVYDQKPSVASNAFVAPCAAVIGNVAVADTASIWCVRRSLVPFILNKLCLPG